MKDYAITLWGNWRPSATQETLDLTGQEIVELDGKPIGGIATRLDAHSLHITRFYLHPDFQNRGIGARVLRRLARRAAVHNVPMRLQVLVTNPALSFYFRNGFVVEAETPERRMMIRYPASSMPKKEDTS